MSIFNDTVQSDLPGQSLIRTTLLDYFENGPGWKLLLNCNPNSEHIGLLTLQCGQVLHNVSQTLWNDCSVRIKNILITHLAYMSYNIKVYVDQYPIGVNWKGLSTIDQTLLIEIFEQYGFQGKSVAHDLLYTNIDVTYEPPVE